MRGLLNLLGSDDAATLIEWLERQLLVGWPAYLSSLAERMPLQDRLRGFRIEAAMTAQDRFIAADLNDIVYRMFPAKEDGYYSDDEILRVIAGVLASLPTPISSASGVATVFRITTPRRASMSTSRRRGPALHAPDQRDAGANIELDVTWSEIGQLPDAGLLLRRWGLSAWSGAWPSP